MKTPEEIATNIMVKILNESLNGNGDCNCGFDEEMGEGYTSGTCLEHQAMDDIKIAIQAERDRAAVLERALEIYANPSEFNDDGDGGWSARQALAEYRKDREV